MRMKLITSAAALLIALGAFGCGDEDEPESRSTTAPAATTANEGATGSTGIETPTTSTTSTIENTGLPEERCDAAESPPNITEVLSYGADCGAVEDAMAEIQSVSESFRIGDFECTRISGGELSGTWECRGEATYFTFQFAD